MKQLIKFAQNFYTKFVALLLCMISGVSSFAGDFIPPETRKHIVWAYDGIMPYIGYVLFGILLISMAYYSIRTWLENRRTA